MPCYIRSIGFVLAGLLIFADQWGHAENVTPKTEDNAPPVVAAKTDKTADDETLHLNLAPESEQVVLKKLMQSGSWTRRAVAAMRLERYGCAESQALLTLLLDDSDWRVRVFAIRSLGNRRIPAGENWFETESNPRVLRAALRYRYPVTWDWFEPGVRSLAIESDLEQKMLAVELGAAGDDPGLKQLANETARTIILRMDRTEAGSLSPRLAIVTGGYNYLRPLRWQQWLRKQGRQLQLQPAHALPEGNQPIETVGFSSLPVQRFIALDDYLNTLDERHLDLAICLDCTASMYSELTMAQAGIDELMTFVGDVAASLRIALVAYRDRRDEFETKVGDFTSDINEARRRLWLLSADGGGDSPEAVYPALSRAYRSLSWNRKHTMVLILIGDAPPHVGYGTHCIELAKLAWNDANLTTHVIQASPKDVDHFPEIAEAGGGQCVNLEEEDSLITEVIGLTLGGAYEEEFRHFFNVYLELCR